MATTLTPEQFKQRYGAESLAKFGTSDQGVTIRPEQTQIVSISPARGQETLQDIKQTGRNIGERFKERFTKDKTEGNIGSQFVQDVGASAGVISGAIGDVFTGLIKGSLNEKQEEAVKQVASNVATKVIQNPAVSWTTKQYVKAYQESSPETQKNLEGLFNIAMLGMDVAGFGTGAKTVKTWARVGIAGGVKLGKQTAKRIFDITKSVPERIANVRNSIGRTSAVRKGAKEGVKKGIKFTDNPTITGALDDIKIMVGLPESTPATDLTFRAVKPRLTESVDLRRIKTQMELANQSIVQNGFKPSTIREYADAVFQTKKKVWSQIQSKLDVGQLAGLEIDLDSIGLKILDMAEDPALARVNPNAVKQLTEITENLTKTGGKVDILEAERIKQFLNAELSDSFGVTDLSQQAKEAKKLITKEIGIQLDDKLSQLPEEFRNLKIEYGSLSAIEEDILKRAIVFERANPEGLADILTKTEAAAEIAFGGTKGRLKGIARLTLGRQLKKANDVNDLIKRAFEKIATNP